MSEEKRERGSGSIFVRGRAVWIQFYTRRGRKRVSAGLSVDEPGWEKKAEKVLRKKLGEVEAGVHQDNGNLRYEHMRQSYFDYYLTNGHKSLRRDRDGGLYLDKVNRLDGFFGGLRASEIDTDLLRQYVADQQSKKLSNGSINRSLSALRRMFYLAQEDGKLSQVPHFPMLAEAAPREGFFERDEYERLLAELPDYLRLPLAIGYHSGMRLGEILGLRWNQIDFFAGTINLRAGETKNNEPRIIPIMPDLRALLIEQRAAQQADCPYVCFRMDRGGRAVQLQSFRKAWASACKRAGIAGRLVHDLRRTGARNLVYAGVPEKVAMKIGGWKTRSVFDRYFPVSPRDLADAAKKLADFHGQQKEQPQFGHSEHQNAATRIVN